MNNLQHINILTQWSAVVSMAPGASMRIALQRVFAH